MAAGRIDGLQVVRGIAALMVASIHAYQFMGRQGTRLLPAGSHVPLLGAAGVDIFFVLSGFVVTMTAFASRDAWGFWMRRAVRIFPFWWLALTAAVAMHYYPPLSKGMPPSAAITGTTLLSSFLLVPDPSRPGSEPFLNVGWSLVYEVYFYVILVLALWLFRKRFVQVTIAFLLLCCLAHPFVKHSKVPVLDYYANYWVFEFVLGIVLLLAYRRAWRPKRTTATVFICLGTATFLSTVVIEPLFQFTWYLGRPVIWGAAGTLIVAGSLAWPAVNSRIGRLGTLLGDASYSLYLSHLLVFSACGWLAAFCTRMVGAGLSALLLVVIAVGASIFLHMYIERPIHHYLKGMLEKPRNEGRAPFSMSSRGVKP